MAWGVLEKRRGDTCREAVSEGEGGRGGWRGERMSGWGASSRAAGERAKFEVHRFGATGGGVENRRRMGGYLDGMMEGSHDGGGMVKLERECHRVCGCHARIGGDGDTATFTGDELLELEDPRRWRRALSSGGRGSPDVVAATAAVVRGVGARWMAMGMEGFRVTSGAIGTCTCCETAGLVRAGLSGLRVYG